MPSLREPDFYQAAEALLEGMISQQRAKVLRLAREAVPNIGPEDVLNPHDFPELKAHPTFEFEDGLLSGLVAAQAAPERPGPRPPRRRALRRTAAARPRRLRGGNAQR